MVSAADIEHGQATITPPSMSTHKVKIIARLRPKIHGELDDDSVKIIHTSDNNGDRLAASGSFVTVPNPRDPTQIFKFPLAYFLHIITLAYQFIRFSSCYDQNSTQEAIYHSDVKPLIDVIYSGIVRFICLLSITLIPSARLSLFLPTESLRQGRHLQCRARKRNRE